MARAPDSTAMPSTPSGGTPSAKTRDFGIAALVAIAPLWGYSWVASKIALDYADPFPYAALVCSLATASLFIILILRRRPLRPPPLRWIIPIGLLQTFLFNGLAMLALSTGSAGKVSVLVYTMPFWLLVLARVFLGERLRGPQWPAVALAFAGLVLVVRPWDFDEALGGVLACAAGIVWAGGSLLVKLLQQRSSSDSLSLTTWQLGVGSLGLVAVALLRGGSGPVWTTTFTLTLAYSVLVANVVCWTLWTLALRTLPAGVAGMGTLAIPAVGVAAAWIQLGDAPAPVEGAGVVLILAALALLAGAGLAAGRRAEAPADAPGPADEPPGPSSGGLSGPSSGSPSDALCSRP